MLYAPQYDLEKLNYFALSLCDYSCDCYSVLMTVLGCYEL